MKRLRVLFIFCFLSFPKLLAEESQFWPAMQFTFPKWGKWQLVVYNQMGLKNGKEATFYLFSPRLSYPLMDNLDLGLNYSFIESRKTSSSGYTYSKQQRYEFELNPHAQIMEKLSFKMRNRLELRRIENQGDNNPRSRHRLRFLWKLEDPVLSQLYADAEFFYDYKRHRYNESRVVPLAIGTKVNEQVGATFYYMVQSQEGTNKRWVSKHIFGIDGSLSF